MKLYFSPGACSLSVHIALREAGLPFELEQVDLSVHKTAGGEDFYAINPKGYVPTVRLSNGEVLTEGTAIVQYIADLAPDKKLAPANGTFERVRLQEWLGFINSEVHKAFSPLFYPDTPEATKQSAIAKLEKRFDYIDQYLANRDYLIGNSFTVADGYLYTVLAWAGYKKIALDRWPKLHAYFQRIGERASVKAAIHAEHGGK